MIQIDTENFVVTIGPAQSDRVIGLYEQMGALDTGFLANISNILGRDIWVVAMPPGTPEEAMVIAGVELVEGEIEHGFFQNTQDLLDPLPCPAPGPVEGRVAFQAVPLLAALQIQCDQAQPEAVNQRQRPEPEQV